MLQALALTAESERHGVFEEVMGCRKRDRAAWEGTAVAKVFSHADHRHLLRMRELSLRVRGGIARQGAPPSPPSEMPPPLSS